MKKTLIVVLIVFALAAGLLAYSEFGMVREMEAVDMAQAEVIEIPAQTETVAQEAIDGVVVPFVEEEELADTQLFELYGEITEITDEYVMIESAEQGQIQVNVSADTVIEGVEALEVGQVVQVIYDGKMTRSLPAQVFGLKIGVYMVTGEVTELTEEGALVAQAGDLGDVLLTLPESAELTVGQAITAYTTGMATMSIPPMMNAVAIK